jgi:hypothetical protein
LPLTVLPTTAGRAIATRPQAQASPRLVKQRALAGTYRPKTKTIRFEDGTTVSVPNDFDDGRRPRQMPPPAPNVGDWPAAPPKATPKNADRAG